MEDMTSEKNEDRDDEPPAGQLQLTNLPDDIEDAANTRPTIAVYARGPDTTTVTESIEERLQYAREALGYELTDGRVEKLTAAPEHVQDGGGDGPNSAEDGAAIAFDTDDDQTGIEYLLNDVINHGIEGIVAAELGEFGGVDAATRTVERLQDEGVTVHLIEDDVSIEPGDDRARALLAAARRASRVDTDASTQLVTEYGTGTKWTGGQPPAGFTVGANGYLQRDEETWETIRQAAAAVEQDELSEYRAAKVADVSRHALRTALGEYRDAYRVEEADPLTIDADADE